MRIGILSQNKEKAITGINRVTQGTLEDLLKIDMENQYYFLGRTDWLNVNIPEIPLIPNGGKIFSLDFAVIAHPLDVVHSHYRPFSIDSKIGVAKILTIHDLIPLIYDDWYCSQYEYFNESIRRCAESADTIITVSEHTKKDVIDYYGIPEDKIEVVYNGLYPKQLFNTTMKGVSVNELEGKRFLLSVSGVGPHKNQVGLAEAFVNYKKKYPDDELQLVLTGPIRRYEVIRDIMKRFPEEGKDIVLTGFVSDEELLWLYQEALAFIYVSYYEGFGLPILEALSVGKAVISSNTSSMPEVGGDAVCYCSPGDIESILYAIVKVVQNDNYRQSLEKSAKQQASKFTYDKSAKKTLDIYMKYGK